VYLLLLPFAHLLLLLLPCAPATAAALRTCFCCRLAHVFLLPPCARVAAAA
jgi:hypothetical protein